MAADRTLAPLALSLALTACATYAPGAFDERGFHSDRFAYEIAWADGAAGTLVGPDWRIASHYVDRRGRLHGPKRGAGYEATLETDLDADGSLEQLGGPYLYDLRLEHARNEGVLFVRHVPVPTELERASLDVVAERWLADFERGEGGLAIPRADRSRARARSIDRRRLGVHGHDAVTVLVEADPVGELAQPSRPPRARAAIVLVRVGFAYEETSARGRRRFQALTIVGYAAPARRFDPELLALRRLLERFRLESGEVDPG